MAKPNAGNRPSYFAERRGANNNPNFFNNIPIDEIRKNVKRIIRDVHNNAILPQDYNYFFNRNIIQACIAECAENYGRCFTINNALNYYLNEVVNRNVSVPFANMIQERITASSEQIIYNTRTQIWYTLLQAFTHISNGADPIGTLEYIRNISIRDINSL